jgi:cytidylate kinase
MHTENLAKTLEHLCRHWEWQRAAASKEVEPRSAPRPIAIAISREAGTLGTAVARETGKLLDWLVYDHELLERIARDMGVRTALLESVDERRMSWIAEAFEASMPTRVTGAWDSGVSESAYLDHLIKTVQALGALGECVIVGRGAAFILPEETTLRIRLVGDARARAKVYASKHGVTEQEAARQLRTIDRERADFVQDCFLKDATAPANYDLVLNAARLPVAEIARLIVEALHGMQKRSAEKSAAPVHGSKPGPSM